MLKFHLETQSCPAQGLAAGAPYPTACPRCGNPRAISDVAAVPGVKNQAFPQFRNPKPASAQTPKDAPLEHSCPESIRPLCQLWPLEILHTNKILTNLHPRWGVSGSCCYRNPLPSPGSWLLLQAESLEASLEPSPDATGASHGAQPAPHGLNPLLLPQVPLQQGGHGGHHNHQPAPGVLSSPRLCMSHPPALKGLLCLPPFLKAFNQQLLEPGAV